MENKISQQKYLEFRMWYYTTDKKDHLRLGQAFLNEFFPTVLDDVLFYETDNNAAQDMIYDRYVDLGD